MWSEPEKVAKHFSLFGVQDIVRHYKLDNRAFFPRYVSLGLPKIDMAFVDGNHSYENARYDFLGTLMHAKKNSYLFLHDTNIYIREMVRNSGVKRWLKWVKKEKELFEAVDFPFSSGVAIVRVLQDDAWKHLEK
jgi:hypothetical protein